MPTAMARLVTPPRWQKTRALSVESAGARQRAHQREGVEVDALGLEAGAAHGLDDAGDHRLAGGHHDDAQAGRRPRA